MAPACPGPGEGCRRPTHSARRTRGRGALWEAPWSRVCPAGALGKGPAQVPLPVTSRPSRLTYGVGGHLLIGFQLGPAPPACRPHSEPRHGRGSYGNTQTCHPFPPLQSPDLPGPVPSCLPLPPTSLSMLSVSSSPPAGPPVGHLLQACPMCGSREGEPMVRPQADAAPTESPAQAGAGPPSPIALPRPQEAAPPGAGTDAQLRVTQTRHECPAQHPTLRGGPATRRVLEEQTEDPSVDSVSGSASWAQCDLEQAL